MSTGPPYAEVQPSVSEQQHEVEESSRNDGQINWGSNRYEPISEIGVGAYGVVFKAKDLQNDDGFVAMKCLRVENTEQGMPLSMVREIALLRQLETKEHPNVIKLLDVCLGRKTSHETQLMLVFEHIDQDLDMYLRRLPEDGLKSKEVKSIMQQILRGIDFLHSMRVIHRDLKPQNILITQSGTIKIADFGLARILSFEMALTAVVVTLWYRSPEVLLQDSYASPVDLWSVGCIFAELYNRRPLFRGTGDVNQLKKIFNFIGRPSNAEWPADVAIPISSFPPQPPRSVRNFIPRMDSLAADLFLKLLSFDPALRPNAKGALEHEYFQVDPVLEESRLAFREEEKQKSTSDFSQHRRLPYTQHMVSGVPYPEEDGAYNLTYQPPSYHDNDVASTSQQLAGRIEKAVADEPQAPEVMQRKKRSFGDVLPVDAKDGASGSLIPQEAAQESAFLTPPSDLASSSRSEGDTTSSSRSSPSEDISLQGPAIAESSTFAAETSIFRPEPPGAAKEAQTVIKRGHKDVEAQSRMSWTSDYRTDPDGAFPEERVTFEPSSRPDFETPTYQILDSGKYVLRVNPPPPEPKPPSQGEGDPPRPK